MIVPFAPSMNAGLSRSPYSCLNVTIGSTRAARRAGTQIASAATDAIRADVEAKATTSNGLIPIRADGQQLRKSKPSGQTDCDSYGHQRQRGAKHCTHDIAALGSERHTDFDLARPLADHQGDDAIQPHRGQHERKASDEARRSRKEAKRSIRRLQRIFDRAHRRFQRGMNSCRFVPQFQLGHGW